jgi:hypothetical protein
MYLSVSTASLFTTDLASLHSGLFRLRMSRGFFRFSSASSRAVAADSDKIAPMRDHTKAIDTHAGRCLARQGRCARIFRAPMLTDVP